MFENQPNYETFTKFSPWISSDHTYIHKGWGFLSAGTASVAAEANQCLTFKTPASGKTIHFRPTVVSTSASYVQVSLLEAPTVTGGTEGTPVNCNRTGTPTASTVTYKFGVTYTSGGTTISTFGVGSTGGPQSRAGGGAGADNEIVLKANTTYAILIANPAGGSTTTVSWNLFWYEED